MPAAAVLLALVVAAAAAPAQPARPGLALLAVTGGKDVDERTLRTVEELLLGALQETGAFRVVGRSDIAQLVGFERQKQLAGCTDESCAAEVAGALGVPLVAAADLGRLGDVTVLSAKIIEATSARVVARANRAVARESRLLDACTEIARELVKEYGPPPPRAPPSAAAPAPAPSSVASSWPRELAVRAGFGAHVGVLGVGAEYRVGRVGLALGSGSHRLAGGVALHLRAAGGGPYLDLHGTWVRSGWIGTQAEPGIGLGATAGWDWRPVRWLSVKAGVGLAWRSGNDSGTGPLAFDLCAGPAW